MTSEADIGYFGAVYMVVVLQRALDLAKRLASEEPHDLVLQRNLSVAQGRVAGVLRQFGKCDRALQVG